MSDGPSPLLGGADTTPPAGHTDTHTATPEDTTALTTTRLDEAAGVEMVNMGKQKSLDKSPDRPEIKRVHDADDPKAPSRDTPLHGHPVKHDDPTKPIAPEDPAIKEGKKRLPVDPKDESFEEPRKAPKAPDAAEAGPSGTKGTDTKEPDSEAGPSKIKGTDTMTPDPEAVTFNMTPDVPVPFPLQITILLTNGARHQWKLDREYLKKEHMLPDNMDPLNLTVMEMKSLIWKRWREEWEPRPATFHSIRLIFFGRLLEDGNKLKDYRFDRATSNVVHMSVRPAETPDDDEGAPAKGGRGGRGARARGGDGGTARSSNSNRCCVIL